MGKIISRRKIRSMGHYWFMRSPYMMDLGCVNLRAKYRAKPWETGNNKQRRRERRYRKNGYSWPVQ